MRFPVVSLNNALIPMVVLVILSMLILPFSPMMLDVMFTINIALTLVVLMVVVNTDKPLDFSIFPRILLLATIIRLGLNVASTRVILMNGHTGVNGAGEVINAFGSFVMGGNFAIGIIVFIILTLISLMVITKGAERITEVKARFSLDSMPGQQMAIDSDLNSGSITQEEASQRRKVVSMESQFFGSMDGTAKFVKGDAYVAIIILAINIIGGLIIGMAQHGMPFGEAIENYTILSVGDGLVTQVPALLMSTATAIMIAGVSGKDKKLETSGIDEVLQHKTALYGVSVLLFLIGLVPEMPLGVFAAAAVALSVITYTSKGELEKQGNELRVSDSDLALDEKPSYVISADNIEVPKVIELRLGMRLLDLVSEKSTFMSQMYSVREELSREMGFIVKGIHVREDSEITPNEYQILFNGIKMGEGAVWTSLRFAMDLDGKVTGPALKGKEAYDPVFGTKGYWIREADTVKARDRGYEISNAQTIVATHMRKLLLDNAYKIIKSEDVTDCIDRVKRVSTKLAEEVTKKVDHIVLLNVFRYLLIEKVSIKNIETIFETIAEYAGKGYGARHLAEQCRKNLADYISADIRDEDNKITAMMFSSALNMELSNGLKDGQLNVIGKTMEEVRRRLLDGITAFEKDGLSPVLLVPTALRPGMADIFGKDLSELSIICPMEISSGTSITSIEI